MFEQFVIVLLLGCYYLQIRPWAETVRGAESGGAGSSPTCENVPVELLRVLSGVPETVGCVEAPGPRVILLDS